MTDDLDAWLLLVPVVAPSVRYLDFIGMLQQVLNHCMLDIFVVLMMSWSVCSFLVQLVLKNCCTSREENTASFAVSVRDVDSGRSTG